ncbi:BPI fold-containing family B member 3-like [Apus apus]|uniref:BPI fold-containing family B member 3-like n=1 Tax=Apus apus TaxID=8895 RepID=UPI0021F8911B|nr:BPI fold-containing family B member 3-like [Apus apus]
MAAFWAVFLLCSQLTLSWGRGIMFLDDKADVDDFRVSQAKRDPQRLPRGLLGGNLLGGLLGKDGAVGSLLGQDGVLGGLLGKDGPVGGLLGKDGAVGSLLGKDGAVGGLLGQDGVLGGLLGKDGAVGSLLGQDGVLGGLLGKDGPVGGLLGKDGAVGSLLGQDGVLGGLLGKDGAVGGLLGKDGAVGSLLGQDGVLGGLLGKDGPVGGLLGKDGAVGSLLGQDGVLGGLLGKDGAVGSLLGQDGVLGGLLGKDGAVGGLLGQDGVLGGLLGKDGAVGGLLGKDGAVGSLLGQDGVLGGLLGKDGAVGGLLGQDGVLGGLLGKDGVVNSLLDRDGILGGVLGKDGVLDALLGKDGLVDGLLGKDGLVDGLLDAVLDILIGKNGILGKNGLVGNLLGGNDGGVTGLKILNNTLPRVHLRSLPGFGHKVGFSTQLLVETTSEVGTSLCVPVVVDAVMLVQDKWATQGSNKDCMTVDMSMRVRPNVPLLDQPLKQLLSAPLREVGCNILRARLGVLGTLLGSGTPAVPLGALGDLPPFSILSRDAVQLELNLLAGDTAGGMRTPAQQGPRLPARLLLLTGRPPRLVLPRRGLQLGLAQAQGAFNLRISDSMVPGSISLSTSSLLPFIPQLARALTTSLPLELLVRVADEPLVTLSSQGATATLRASIDVTIPALQSSQKLLFSVDADIVVNIIPSVSDGKVQMSLALDSIRLTRIPQGLDPLSVSSLAEWLKQVLMAAYIPAVNNALHVSVPLPSTLSSSLRSVEMDVMEADNFPDQMVLRGSCPGGPLALLAL